MKYIYIHYKKTNNDPFYVGQGSKYRLDSTCGRSDYWWNIVKKHGYYTIKIIDNLTIKGADFFEQQLIKLIREQGYKLCNIESGGLGFIMSEETKLKISIANKGKKKPTRSKEHCQKLALANTGKIVSQETKDKISKFNKGKTLSEETKQILSKVHTGKILSQETKDKISKGNKGKKRTEEQKLRRPPFKITEETRKKLSDKARSQWAKIKSNKK